MGGSGRQRRISMQHWMRSVRSSSSTRRRRCARATSTGVCRAVAPASGRTRSSGIDDGDGLYLDHQIGSGETGDADGRAGRGRHAEIAHADIGALLELVEVGDKGVGLDDIGPGGAGRLETPVEVLERLFHLRPHFTFANTVAIDVT